MLTMNAVSIMLILISVNLSCELVGDLVMCQLKISVSCLH